MRRNKLKVLDVALLALAILTVVMWLMDQLPASKAELVDVVAMAAPNAEARQAVVSALSDDPAPNRRDARHLRERVIAIERATQRLSENPTARAMTGERERLAALPLAQMSFGDIARWGLLWVARYVTLIVGTFAGLCGLMVVRNRGRLSSARS
ncbi:hypothetical protein [Paraburkholderia hospita]|uniref:hypothetical protein n=1 Tax=Paraburkholderia hospita TaxID=169430 RepID=UPI0008A7F9B5|nr:hypothetical protein [Paraburkholderia hospita]SEI14873.1 hypothetical protein SAMN05192544_1025129 [Paraburkholderia hospita]